MIESEKADPEEQEDDLFSGDSNRLVAQLKDFLGGWRDVWCRIV